MSFEEKIKERYSGESGEKYHQTKRSIPDIAYNWIANLRSEKISPYIDSDDIIFEYGVGTGWNLAKLNCKKKLGYDLSKHLEQTNEIHGIEFIEDLSSLNKSSIDVIICHHALEHMPVPTVFFNDIRAILRDKGKLLLFVPFEKEKRYRYYNPNEPNHHVYSWNVQTLGNLVTDMGFKIIQAKVHQFGYDRVASVWAVKLNIGEKGFRLIRRALHIIKPALEVCIIAVKE